MISLLGLFVITSSACFTTTEISSDSFRGVPIVMSHTYRGCVQKFERVDTSSATKEGETATPVCQWVGHKFSRPKHIEPPSSFSAFPSNFISVVGKCPICGDDMIDPNPMISCLVYHSDGHCSWHDPVCVNRENHNIEVCEVCGKRRTKVTTEYFVDEKVKKTKEEWIEEKP